MFYFLIESFVNFINVTILFIAQQLTYFINVFRRSNAVHEVFKGLLFNLKLFGIRTQLLKLLIWIIKTLYITVNTRFRLKKIALQTTHRRQMIQTTQHLLHLILQPILRLNKILQIQLLIYCGNQLLQRQLTIKRINRRCNFSLDSIQNLILHFILFKTPHFLFYPTYILLFTSQQPLSCTKPEPVTTYPRWKPRCLIKIIIYNWLQIMHKHPWMLGHDTINANTALNLLIHHIQLFTITNTGKSLCD